MRTTKIRAALEALLAEGKPAYCEHADECFCNDLTGWLAREDPESSACGGCWFTHCSCATEAQRQAADALMGRTDPPQSHKVDADPAATQTRNFET